MKHRWHSLRQPVDHTDDWLMTYADMITLLLCFFAIFLSVSMSTKGVPKRADTAETVAPVQRTEPLPIKVAAPRVMQPAPVATVDAEVLTRVQQALHDIDDAARPASSTPSMDLTAHSTTPQTSAVKQAGDRLTSIEVSSAAIFGSGSATLNSAGEALLGNVFAELASDTYKDYGITVEGHTDDTPIHTAQFPSNWELSTARAAAVVHYLLTQGFPADRIHAVGYADTAPELPNRDADGNPLPDNQARNRRVVIKLEKLDKG